MILAYVRTVILYLVLIASVRIMGKRQIGQMEPTEFVVAMLIADLAAVPMQDGAIPLLSGIVPLLTVLGLELTVSFLVMKSLRLRRCLCGRPVILIDNGRVLQDNLRRTRITVEEEGVTAASYIKLRFGAGAAAPPEEIIDFVLDRPFLFAISCNGIPMFMGTVQMP